MEEERDPLGTMLREGHKFLDHAQAKMGIAPQTDPYFGPIPPITPGRRLDWHPTDRPSVDTGNMVGVTALAWGMFRAIYEYPNCPDHYRVPMEQTENGWRQLPYEQAKDDQEWQAIACPHCHGLWTRKEEPKKAVQRSLFDEVA